MESGSNLPKYKLVFLGDVGVGKTSIIKQFMSESFDSTYSATVGIDFLSKNMHLGDRTIRLQLWDTAGQERFRSLIPNYIRESAAAIVVFDICEEKTFESIERWVEDVRAERGQEAALIVVGNKIDQPEARVVDFAVAEAKSKGLNVAYIETSAKTGENVKKLFKTIAGMLPIEESVKEKGIVVQREEDRSESKCKC